MQNLFDFLGSDQGITVVLTAFFFVYSIVSCALLASSDRMQPKTTKIVTSAVASSGIAVTLVAYFLIFARTLI